MEAYDRLLTRRSVRSFRDESVPEDVLMKVIRAGMYAPSANDQRPWQFYVVEDRHALEEMGASIKFGTMIPDAPVAILVCGDMGTTALSRSWPLDCSAATMCMLMAAHLLTLGSVWVGLYPEAERMNTVKRILQLPDGHEPFSILPVGYPNKEPNTVERFDSARIHRVGGTPADASQHR